MNVPHDPDDLLARATAALRDTPVPDGPSEATVERTLAALRAAADRPQVEPGARKRLMFTLSKVAAAVLLAVAGAYYVAVPHPATANTFAEMAAKLHAAHTMTYRQAMQTPGLKEPVRTTVYIKVPDHFRSETDGGGPIVIVDSAQRKTLMLDPKSKTAMLSEDKGPKPPDNIGTGRTSVTIFPIRENKGSKPSQDMVVTVVAPKGPKPPAGGADVVSGMAGAMRSLEKADSKPAGERQIGGVKTRGFRIMLSPQQDMTVWVNTATNFPVLMESVAHAGGMEVRITMSDYVLDRELDDSLFRVVPPEGYTVRTVPAENMRDAEVKTVEEAAAQLLKVYTEKSGGTFPPKLDDFGMFSKILASKEVKAGAALPDPELLKAVTVMVRFNLSAREINNQYGYKPDGAKLGDASRVIFWYKPAGSATYRAVFADLHIGDVAADKLPEVPRF
jgi:outer membrane lipoprotein-sorting protein